jgi:hypothetical protein
MASVKRAYGTNGQSITCTLTSLTTGSARASTVVDNTTNLYLDALVQVQTKTGTGPAVPNIINVYAYATVDNGTTYSDGATGSDAGITLTAPPNAVLIGSINVPAASTSYKSGPMSVAAAFGGILPAKWGVIIENQSGTTLSATGGDHVVQYQGVYATVA